MVAVASDHLGCCVTGTTTRCLQSLTLFIDVTQAKIDDFELSIEVDQQVFRLKISMAYAKLVDVVNAGHELLEMLTGSTFLEFLILNNKLEKFTSRGELHDKV